MCQPPNGHPETARRVRPPGYSDQRVLDRKRDFPRGTRVRLVRWAPSEVPGLEEGEPNYPVGSAMTVRDVDDGGTIWGAWDHLGGLSGIGISIQDEAEIVDAD